MKNAIFWVIVFSVIGMLEVFIGVKLFRDEFVAAGIFLIGLGIVSFIVAGIIGVLG